MWLKAMERGSKGSTMPCSSPLRTMDPILRLVLGLLAALPEAPALRLPLLATDRRDTGREACKQTPPPLCGRKQTCLRQSRC